MSGAIFFDRDNTLIVDKGYTWKISDFAFLSDSAEALALLHIHQIPVFIVTNQSGIARGYYSETDMLKFNQHLQEEVTKKGGRITDIAYCPHHLDYPETKENSNWCTCRK
ncbi:HAD-IIIA family hydrolase, partial [Alphaproteobacteria bacterium]|nr:HAD-IIIA family hydrolase [Alphaproteobacteria bacterium]